ncbi:MAG: long-chain fatty acid--CoA ligase [Candidatus Omnitrophica bacterium]|nr:long-chain fatty acid--CoA ligase [Candidatus Omnitrophota bacterium]
MAAWHGLKKGSSSPVETIPSRFFRQAEHLAQKPLFLAKRGGAYQAITWREAQEQVQDLSTFLMQHQINVGDRILILSENRPEWAIADVAIQSAGAWSVPLYPSLTAEEILGICRDCQPVGGVVSTIDQAKKLVQVARQVPSLQFLLVMEEGAGASAIQITWREALAQGRQLRPKLESLLTHRREQLRAEETATLIYTSGTTGEPKGVMLSHRNFLSNVDACLEVIPISAADTHLSFLPLSHVFERMAGWYLMFTAGASVAYAENMETIPQNMAEVHPTVMLGVPRFFEKLSNKITDGIRQASPAKRRLAEWALRIGQASAALRLAGTPLPLPLRLKRAMADRLVFHTLKAKLGGRLRFFVSGGAPLSKSIGEFFYSLGVTIIEGYGLTETSPVIAANRLDCPRFGSVGPAIPGVEVWIAEDGEVLTRGPHIMQGYYNKPEATAAAIVDGWFHTGDIGHLDQDGWLHITDRKKDLIKTAGGKFVAPQKLEGLFVTDPAVSQAFVYGDKQPYCVALIVPNAEQLLRVARERQLSGTTAKELVNDPQVQQWYWERIQAKQQGLAGFEQVKKIALLDREFTQAGGELTPTLKAKRAIIAQRHEALLRGLYAQPPAS